MNTEHTEMPNDRSWWSRLFNLDYDARVGFIVDLYNSGELSDAQLWDALSSHHGPVTSAQAKIVYTELGYVPFSGYPLVRITSGGES